MLTIVSLVVQQALPQLRSHLQAALRIGVTPIEVREAIYQCAPFIGFPKTLNALTILNEVFSDNNITTPLDNTATITEDNRFEKGRAIQESIYDSQIENLLDGLPNQMNTTIARLVTEVCFGDFYTRKGLSLEVRELLTIGILLAHGQKEFLRNHLLGNLRVGTSPQIIVAAIIQCIPYVGFPYGIEALEILKDIILNKE